MMMDCFEDIADKLILVSADSDLISTIETLKLKFPQKDIKVYFPPKRTSGDLYNICKPVVYLEKNKAKFERAILPNIVSDGTKKFIQPSSWM